jgi:hypothetical protein
MCMSWAGTPARPGRQNSWSSWSRTKGLRRSCRCSDGRRRGVGESAEFPTDVNTVVAMCVVGTPVLFSPSVRRRRCSQVGQDVLRQDAAVLRYVPRAIRIMHAQKSAPFPGRAPDVLARLHLAAYSPSDLDTKRVMNVARRFRYALAQKYERFSITEF